MPGSPTTLANRYLSDGGPCFTAEVPYRLISYRDGGIVELIDVDGALRTATPVEGFFALESFSLGDWFGFATLTFARPARGWTLPVTCTRGEPIGRHAFSCDGHILFDDGGAGSRAADWVDGEGVAYGFLDGGLVTSTNLTTSAAFAPHPERIEYWAADRSGLATLGRSNVLRLFAADGGVRELQLLRDAGAGNVFRHDGVTSFTKYGRVSTDLCAVGVDTTLVCVPGNALAASGALAWALPVIGYDGEWSVVPMRYDGGWTDGDPNEGFHAPPGWWPLGTVFPAMASGIVVRSSDQRRALAWFGIRGGMDEMVLLDSAQPLVSFGARGRTAWFSWDGGTLVAPLDPR